MDRLIFCGTGAADYSVPVPGEEFRKTTHSLLNDVILLDIGFMTYLFEDQELIKARLSKVKDVIVTHAHGDHFSIDALMRLAEDNGGITVYVDRAVVETIPVHPLIHVVPLTSGEQISIRTTDGVYTVAVLSSNHCTHIPNEQTHHYVIDTPHGKSLFYGLDGAWFTVTEAAFLMQHPVDLMVLDCTLGRIHGDKRIFEHNSIDMLELMLETIRKCKMLKPDGQVYADHLARTLHPCHNEAAAVLAEIGVCTARDGLCIEF